MKRVGIEELLSIRGRVFIALRTRDFTRQIGCVQIDTFLDQDANDSISVETSGFPQCCVL